MRKRSKTDAGGVERREVVIINRPFVSPPKSCASCPQPSGMITPDEAAALCCVSTRYIYRWLESGDIHFSETSGEGLLICLSSLAEVALNDGRAETGSGRKSGEFLERP